jgi:prevent-host-death family protein
MKAGKKNATVEVKSEAIGLFEAKTHLSKIVREARAGKRFVITQRGKPVVEIRAVEPEARRPSLWGDMKGKIWMADDFCDPLPELEKYFT